MMSPVNLYNTHEVHDIVDTFYPDHIDVTDRLLLPPRVGEQVSESRLPARLAPSPSVPLMKHPDGEERLWRVVFDGKWYPFVGEYLEDSKTIAETNAEKIAYRKLTGLR